MMSNGTLNFPNLATYICPTRRLPSGIPEDEDFLDTHSYTP